MAITLIPGQSKGYLPDADEVFNFLRLDCLTENISEESLQKISGLVANALFDRSAMEKKISTELPQIDRLKIIEIGYTLQCCAKGEKPSISWLKKNKNAGSSVVKETPKKLINVSTSYSESPDGEVGFLTTRSSYLVSNPRVQTSKASSRKEMAAVVTPEFPELYERSAERVGSFNELWTNLCKLLDRNRSFTNKYYYKNGILKITYEPLNRYVSITAEDVSKKMFEKLQDQLNQKQLQIKSLQNHSSTPAQLEMRMKKELCNHSYYYYMLDSSFAPSDDVYEREGYLVKWEKIQFMTMEEVKELNWESKYLDKNWSTLETAKMSEPFMRAFSDCINWFQLKQKPCSLSKKFRDEFQDRLK